MAVQLCTATSSDLPAIREIYAPFAENTAISLAYDPPSVADLGTKLKQKTDYPWLVYELDGEVAGYVYAGMIRERIAYRQAVETSIYVCPEFQRRGVAHGLYTALLDLPERQGCVSVIAVITTSNPASITFHKPSGFERVSRFERAGYRGDMWHGVKWWGLDLDDRPNDPDASLSVADARDRDRQDDALIRDAALIRSSA